MSYCEKRESMVNICHALMSHDWQVYGYSPDRSDSMTDCYCPASWSGVASKNGYVLCVNVSDYQVQSSRQPIYDYHQSAASVKDSAKIAQLRILARDKGATEGEKAAALAAIERIHTRQKQGRGAKVFRGHWPEFHANPPHCNWHIEKAGNIVAKGMGAFSFCDLPIPIYIDMDFNKELSKYKLAETEKERVQKFQRFIDRLEKVVSPKIGKGKDDCYQVVTKTQKVKIRHAEPLPDQKEGRIAVGSCFQVCAKMFPKRFQNAVYCIVAADEEKVRAARFNKSLTKLLSSHSDIVWSGRTGFEDRIRREEIVFVDIQEETVDRQVQKCVKKG